MFASNSCYRPLKNKLFRFPLFFDFNHLSWGKKILIIILVILACLAFGWVIRHKQFRRWLSSPKGILLLFGFTAILPLMLILAEKALVVFLPPDSGAVANAIVVLGRGTPFEQQRIHATAELWQAGRSPIIFASGMGDAPRMIKQLGAKGIPQQALNGESCSRTTWENAIFTAAILLPQKKQRILLITDAPHMLRSLLVYQALGFTVIPHPLELPPGFSFKATAFLTFREYMGLIAYGFRGLFFQQRLSELKNPELVNLVQQAEQYGQQQPSRTR